MQGHEKHMRAALQKIKALAKSKSAERMKARASAKSAPKEPPKPKEEKKPDALEKALDTASEPVEDAAETKPKTSQLILGGVKKTPRSMETAPEPPKRKRGRPPKVKV